MSIKIKIIDEAKRVEEDALVSSKSHFEASSFWNYLYYWLGIPSALLAGIAGKLALDSNSVPAAMLSFTAAVLTGVSTFVRPNEKAIQHRRAGNEYNSLKNAARIFYSIEAEQEVDEKQLVIELKKLDERRSRLNKESPLIPRAAFKKANDGIQRGESNYRVDS